MTVPGKATTFSCPKGAVFKLPVIDENIITPYQVHENSSFTFPACDRLYILIDTLRKPLNMFIVHIKDENGKYLYDVAFNLFDEQEVLSILNHFVQGFEQKYFAGMDVISKEDFERCEENASSIEVGCIAPGTSFEALKRICDVDIENYCSSNGEDFVRSRETAFPPEKVLNKQETGWNPVNTTDYEYTGSLPGKYGEFERAMDRYEKKPDVGANNGGFVPGITDVYPRSKFGNISFDPEFRNDEWEINKRFGRQLSDTNRRDEIVFDTEKERTYKENISNAARMIFDDIIAMFGNSPVQDRIVVLKHAIESMVNNQDELYRRFGITLTPPVARMIIKGVLEELEK